VVFNLFHAATHFATQFNLTTPFRKFPVRHMKCSCVFTTENNNEYFIRSSWSMNLPFNTVSKGFHVNIIRSKKLSPEYYHLFSFLVA